MSEVQLPSWMLLRKKKLKVSLFKLDALPVFAYLHLILYFAQMLEIQELFSDLKMVS